MIVIQGMFEGDIVAQERVAEKGYKCLFQALVQDLYASGCDFVQVTENLG